MRRLITFTLLILLLALAGLFALPVLSPILSSGNVPGGLIGIAGPPTAVSDQDEAIQSAITFMDAWARRDYSTMYGLISPKARDAYIQSDFEAIYEGIWRDLNIASLSWERGQVVTQGTTVLFQYHVTFSSSVLGEFKDSDRIMRIIPTGEGMRIAWSRMDIFEGWSSGARLQVERTLASRGNIYDSEGRPLADQNGVALPIYLVRNNMTSDQRCIVELVGLLGREYDDLEDQFLNYNRDTIFYVGEIDLETYQNRGQGLDIECNPYQIAERNTRRYFGTAAPHVVGFVGRIPNELANEYELQGYPVDALVGRTGVELAWEDELRGDIGNRLALISIVEEPIRVITENSASPGQSAYLTINRDLQLGVQEALAGAYSNAYPTWSPNSPGAAVVILDVHTGAVLAMASYPGFDPAVFNPDSPYLNSETLIEEYNSDRRRPLLNRATQGRYPLGSVFKLVSSVAGADSTLVPFDRRNTCTGIWDGSKYGLEDKTDWFKEGHGVLDGRGAIINSCNPYYWELSVTLNNADPNLLPAYAAMFGFGSRTGIRGVEEDRGYIPSPDALREQGLAWDLSIALNLVIGQGEVAVNPLQVARMVAVIANGGKLVTPYVVEEVKLIGEEPSYVHQPEFTQLNLDPAVLAEVRKAMCQVTTAPTGTATFVFDQWYETYGLSYWVCGKTGTAQSGTENPHAWFASFVPADNPEIAIAVVVENSCEGSEVAAPITRRVVEIYYGLGGIGWPPLWQSGCSEIVVE